MPVPHPARLLPAAFALAASFATAQVPPIKPGLWQAQTDRSVDGKPAPDMSERLKNLPPAARQQMEAMMKQRGVDTSGGGMRLCMTRESLDQGRWNQAESRCRTEFGTRSASAWKWRSVCTQPDSTSDGEAVFHSPESYTMTLVTTMQRQGQPHSTKHVAKMQWLGADCGDVKPLQPGPKR
jgi:hypothetical protein